MLLVVTTHVDTMSEGLFGAGGEHRVKFAQQLHKTPTIKKEKKR